MNTKTMRLPPRRVLTSDKRVIAGTAVDKPPRTAVINSTQPPPSVKSILKKTVAPPTFSANAAVKAESTCPNQLLAGYLAHEFLNKGTLCGEEWDTVRAQSGPFTAQSTEARKTKPSQNMEPSNDHKRRRYVEVANILRVDGTHLPGIVNPSQLARSFNL